jgi:hypothetical protein
MLATVLIYLVRRPLEGIGLCALGGWITYVLVAAFWPEKGDVADERSEPIPGRLAA